MTVAGAAAAVAGAAAAVTMAGAAAAVAADVAGSAITKLSTCASCSPEVASLACCRRLFLPDLDFPFDLAGRCCPVPAGLSELRASVICCWQTAAHKHLRHTARPRRTTVNSSYERLPCTVKMAGAEDIRLAVKDHSSRTNCTDKASCSSCEKGQQLVEPQARAGQINSRENCNRASYCSRGYDRKR